VCTVKELVGCSTSRDHAGETRAKMEAGGEALR
jgi:hypothetical protein